MLLMKWQELHDSAVVGVEAFQVKIQMTLGARHPALFFIQSFKARATFVDRTGANFDVAWQEKQ